MRDVGRAPGSLSPLSGTAGTGVQLLRQPLDQTWLQFLIDTTSDSSWSLRAGSGLLLAASNF